MVVVAVKPSVVGVSWELRIKVSAVFPKEEVERSRQKKERQQTI